MSHVMILKSELEKRGVSANETALVRLLGRDGISLSWLHEKLTKMSIHPRGKQAPGKAVHPGIGATESQIYCEPMDESEAAALLTDAQTESRAKIKGYA